VMTWTSSANEAWMTVTPLAGTDDDTLDVSVSPPSPGVATYNGEITVDAGGAGTETVAVTFFVNPVCGANGLEAPFEECDLSDPVDVFGGETCNSYGGFGGGELECVSCSINVSKCIASVEGGLVPCGRVTDDFSTPGIDESQPCGFCHSFQLVHNIINVFLFPFVPAIGGLLLVIGGFSFFVGGGNPATVSRGKTIIVGTVIGLVIVYSAWLVINTALDFIGIASWTGLGTWWEITC